MYGYTMTALGRSIRTTARLSPRTPHPKAVSVVPFRAHQRHRAARPVRAGAAGLTGLPLELATAPPELIANVAGVPAAALAAGAAVAGTHSFTF